MVPSQAHADLVRLRQDQGLRIGEARAASSPGSRQPWRRSLRRAVVRVRLCERLSGETCTPASGAGLPVNPKSRQAGPWRGRPWRVPRSRPRRGGGGPPAAEARGCGASQPCRPPAPLLRDPLSRDAPALPARTPLRSPPSSPRPRAEETGGRSVPERPSAARTPQSPRGLVPCTSVRLSPAWAVCLQHKVCCQSFIGAVLQMNVFTAERKPRSNITALNHAGRAWGEAR